VRARQGARRAIFASALLLAAGPVSSAAEPAPTQSYDGYKSWLVACDNTLSCVAKALAKQARRR